MKFKCLFFLFLCTIYADAQTRMKPNTVGNTLDESFVYKAQKAPKSLADKSRDAISFLKLSDKNNRKLGSGRSGIGTSEAFTLETVNGDPITNIDVMNATKLIFFLSGREYDKDIAKMMAPAVIESLEDDKLRTQCARLFGIRVTDKDVEKEVLRLASMNNISVSELEKRVLSYGISVKTFRRNIKSRLVFQIIAQYLADNDRVTPDEVETAKKERQALMASKRYLISEIFRYNRSSLEKIRTLALKGFDFQTLAENFSQVIKVGKRGAPKWYKATSLEPEVVAKLQSMKTGAISDIINTKSGHKVVCLIDVAEAGKAASSEATYKILRATVAYRSNLFTKKDVEKIEVMLDAISHIETAGNLKRYCLVNDIKLEEEAMSRPHPYYMEMILKSKESGKPVISQSIDDPNNLNIIMYLKEDIQRAQLPDEKELKESVSEKKMDDAFTKNFKNLKRMAHIQKQLDNINRVTQ